MPESFWEALLEPEAEVEYDALGVALGAFLPEDCVGALTRSERRIALGAICLMGWFTDGDPEFLRSSTALVPTHNDAGFHAKMNHLAQSIEALERPMARPREEDAPEALAPMGELRGATEERFGAVREVERLDGHWLRWPWTEQKGTNQI